MLLIFGCLRIFLISNVDDNNCNPTNLDLRTNSKLAIIEFTIKEISDILKSLNIKKKPPGTIEQKNSFLSRDIHIL
jgi:hypothetical protein